MATASKKAAAKKSAESGPAKVEKEMVAVRERHAELREAARDEGRTVTSFVVHGKDDEDGEPQGEIRLKTAGGLAFIEADGEVVLDRDGVADLMRFANAVFQAVA